jgi:hypothetical protein
MNHINKLLLLATLCFTVLPASASYHHFRKGLKSAGCTTDSKIETIIAELPLMENYLKGHARCSQAQYDYGMMLYVLALRDRGKSEVYLNKSLKAFDAFIALHPKNTYAGYWNKAILLAYSLHCNDAIIQLNKAKENCPNLSKNWDEVSEKNIIGKCGSK